MIDPFGQNEGGATRSNAPAHIGADRRIASVVLRQMLANALILDAGVAIGLAGHAKAGRSNQHLVGERPAGRLPPGVHAMSDGAALHEQGRVLAILSRHGCRQPDDVPRLGSVGDLRETGRHDDDRGTPRDDVAACLRSLIPFYFVDYRYRLRSHIGESVNEVVRDLAAFFLFGFPLQVRQERIPIQPSIIHPVPPCPPIFAVAANTKFRLESLDERISPLLLSIRHFIDGLRNSHANVPVVRTLSFGLQQNGGTRDTIFCFFVCNPTPPIQPDLI